MKSVQLVQILDAFGSAPAGGSDPGIGQGTHLQPLQLGAGGVGGAEWWRESSLSDPA